MIALRHQDNILEGLRLILDRNLQELCEAIGTGSIDWHRFNLEVAGA